MFFAHIELIIASPLILLGNEEYDTYRNGAIKNALRFIRDGWKNGR